MQSIVTAIVLLLCACNSFSVQIFFDIEKDVFFKLYKRDNPTNFTVLSAYSSWDEYSLESFDPKIPTKIAIHGYLASSGTIDQFRQAYLNVASVNFISVDWTRGAFNVNYYVSKARITLVADKLAGVINALIEKGMHLKDLTLVGHSLGAHLAGLAAKRLNSTEKVGTIIGLDPASVGFSIKDAKNRLDKSDADYVQVLHTDIRMYGFDEPIGHADIYPHRGQLQPGCLNVTGISILDKCSHARAYEIFFESLKSDFVAIKCASYKEIQQNKCSFDNVTTIVGGKICATPNKPHGQFYMETNRQTPFVIPDFNTFNEINMNPDEIEEVQPIPNTLPESPTNHKRLVDLFKSVKEIYVSSGKNKTFQNQVMIKGDGVQKANASDISNQNSTKGYMSIFTWSNDKNVTSKIPTEQKDVQSGDSLEKSPQNGYMDMFMWSKGTKKAPPAEPMVFKSNLQLFIDMVTWTKETVKNQPTEKPIEKSFNQRVTDIFYTPEEATKFLKKTSKEGGFTSFFNWSKETQSTPEPEISSTKQRFMSYFNWPAPTTKKPIQKTPLQSFTNIFDWSKNTKESVLPEKSPNNYKQNFASIFQWSTKAPTPKPTEKPKTNGFTCIFNWSKPTLNVSEITTQQPPQQKRTGYFYWSKESPKNDTPVTTTSKPSLNKSFNNFFKWSSGKNETIKSENSEVKLEKLEQNPTKQRFGYIFDKFRRRNETTEEIQKNDTLVTSTPQPAKQGTGFTDMLNWFKHSNVTSQMKA